MNDQKCEEIRHRLEALLKQHRLEWVIGQVNEEIRSGKMTSEAVVAVKDEASVPSEIRPTRKPRVTKEKFLRRVNYTKREQLVLLIDAVERAVVDVIDLGLQVGDFVEKESVHGKEVKFASEEEGVHGRLFSPSEAISRKGSAAKLKTLLAGLKKEALTNAH